MSQLANPEEENNYPHNLSELTLEQREHLAFVLDAKTPMGVLTAASVARLELGDMPLDEVFLQATDGEWTQKHARQVATRVWNYCPPELLG